MIRAERDGPIARITLDRPDRKNALTPEMLDAVVAEAVGASAWARALVLEGAGDVFCSGFDLTLCREDPHGGALRAMLTGLSAAIRSLRDAPIPVIVAAHGAAIAGGCALLGGADIVVTNSAAKLGYPVVRLGISPSISAPFLRGAVGDGACRERLLDSGLIDGREALRLGLVHEVVLESTQVQGRARAIAMELMAKPAGAMAATKRWLMEIDEGGASALGRRKRGSAPQSDADRALDASLSLVGNREERERMAALWGGRG
jgi:methylglutaconyl-CoA hydratase